MGRATIYRPAGAVPNHKRDTTGKRRGPYAQAMTPEALVRSATAQSAVPFVPEIRLATAAEPYGLWDSTAREAPPFWAFPWAGGQGLARYVLDHPGVVRGRRVLDVASGSGLVAIAAAKAGAARVTAGDIDELAVAAIGVNAAANGMAAVVTARQLDFAAGWGGTDGGNADGGDDTDSAGAADVVLAADVFYQRELAALALAFLSAAARSGADVLVADPGRAFVPRAALTPLTTCELPVLSVLEDGQVKTVTIYRLEP
jgi:predicted nicotinamide N-methyase